MQDRFTAFLLSKISGAILNPIIGLLFALALVLFLWGVVQFIMNAENEEARKNGGRHMLFGIIGIAIMVSVVGILRIVINTFGLPTPPGLPF